jgi:hypothetical protein
MGCLALPDDQRVPAILFQLPQHERVPRLVVRKLVSPEFDVGLGRICKATPLMAVPKAAMDKDNLAATGENEIGRSGQIATVQPEAITEPVSNLPDNKLWPRVPASDSAHHSGSGVRVDDVHTRSQRPTDPNRTKPVDL